jgi:hypothetical protein
LTDVKIKTNKLPSSKKMSFHFFSPKNSILKTRQHVVRHFGRILKILRLVDGIKKDKKMASTAFPFNFLIMPCEDGQQILYTRRSKMSLSYDNIELDSIDRLRIRWYETMRNVNRTPVMMMFFVDSLNGLHVIFF